MSRHTRSATGQSSDSMDEEATKFILYLQQALQDDHTVKILRKALEPTQLMNDVKELTKKVGTLERIIENKNEKITALEKTIKTIESKQDAQEQHAKRDSLRISGLVESQDENIEEKVIKSLNESMVIEPPLTNDDIAYVHRVGREQPGKPRPIIIKMSNYRKRQAVFKMKKTLANSPLSINEDLTPIRAKLLFRAREARRKGLITAAWSSDGRIVMKLRNNAIRSATTSDELDSIIGPTPTTSSS